MTIVQWLYSSGQSWLCLDTKAQQQIEQLWCGNQASWVTSEAFRGPIYVDTAMMTLIYNGYSYTIARLRR
ncbi:hypothetical protein V8B55DRAFT_1505412 [Mucor lusitanicus]|uniref:WWE domain-containing protein n=1 Tax=Mucor circinelloides f. lusitanicus TaxID=29924 RepID=A0A8H4BLB2_MUCCL|nr:hypothetical protein FB192DRAFT_1368096 [Mucor lusitanicus]